MGYNLGKQVGNATLLESGTFVSLGGVSGASPIVKFGHCSAAQNGVETDAWELGDSIPVYVFPDPTGETLTIESSSASDGQAITVELLDAVGEQQNVTVNLNGITPVAISGTFIAVNRAYNDDTTSTLGSVSIKGSVSGNTFAYIDVKEQQTTQCIYLVPAGKYAVLRNVSSSINTGGNSDNAAVVKFTAQLDGKAKRTQIRYGLQQRGTSNLSSDIIIPPVYPPLTRLKVSFTPDSNQDVSAEMSMMLLDSDVYDKIQA